jgi:hypothetical protein
LLKGEDAMKLLKAFHSRSQALRSEGAFGTERLPADKMGDDREVVSGLARVSTACLLIDRATGGPRGFRRNVPFGQ